ncbi:MAG: hypothetical protein EOO06_19745, partial [Chitinophagaceae bacterium]
NNAGIQNTAIGFQAMYNNWYGNRNTAMGYSSLMFNQTSSDNTALGHSALWKSTGGANTAVGSQSLNANTSGIRSTAVGYNSLSKNTTGDFNTAVGSLTLDGNVDGMGNTAMGDFTMRSNISGSYNAAFGAQTLSSIVSGSYNTGIGFKADILGGNYSNATAVGAFSEVGCSNCVVLGSINGYNGATASSKVGIGTISPQRTLHVNPNGAGGILIGNDMTTGGYTGLQMGISQASGGYSYIQSVKAAWPSSTYGDLVLNQSGGFVGIGKSAPITPLHIKQSTDNAPYNGGIRMERHDNGNFWDIALDYANVMEFSFMGVNKVRFSPIDGDIWTASDFRLKKDIQNFEVALPRLMKLEAKSYHYNDNEASAPLSYGFIAQDVEKIFPGAVSTNSKDGMKAIAYQKLNMLAIKSIQEQQVIIEDQGKRIATLEQKLEAILNEIKK